MLNKSEINNAIQEIADELRVSPSFIEKDLYAMKVLETLREIDHPTLQLVFSGGTSLSKGYGLIQRFSEDLDFKVDMSESPSRPERKEFRNLVLDTLTNKGKDWQPDLENVMAGNSSKFFRIPILYPAEFSVSDALRPYIQLEVSFEQPALSPESRSLQSFVGAVLNQAPEAQSFPLISPIETAANKLSALTWRVLSRDRESSRDDPTLVRHLHDLAELKGTIESSKLFSKLVLESLAKDVSRASYEQSDAAPKEQLHALYKTLRADAAYQGEYQKFVLEMSYADENARPSFEDSLTSLEELIDNVVGPIYSSENQEDRISESFRRTLSDKEYKVLQSVLNAYALGSLEDLAQIMIGEEMSLEEAQSLFNEFGLDINEYVSETEIENDGDLEP